MLLQPTDADLIDVMALNLVVGDRSYLSIRCDVIGRESFVKNPDLFPKIDASASSPLLLISPFFDERNVIQLRKAR